MRRTGARWKAQQKHNKERRLANRERRNESNRKYRAANSDKVKASIRRTRTGFLPEFAKGLFKLQRESCAICGKKLNFNHAHADHDHYTNKPRGFLCRGCNTALGSLGDNLEGLERAMKYLRNPPANGVPNV